MNQQLINTFHRMNRVVQEVVQLVQKCCFLSNLRVRVFWSGAKTEIRLTVRGKAVNENEFSALIREEKRKALALARTQVRAVFERDKVTQETIAQVSNAKLVANYLGDYRI